ncbi:hypothetical protein L1987_17287 [Smallanthus sonchifolius]|uniref:Uncharacterized protein n=1 Tax=Smallanthus sonchifolius TaxID=185202 RepID=A0ACB9IYI7_9ASTR|nr:hypothetical protein L1987_17287 [Smallanthus sonchifolius]
MKESSDVRRGPATDWDKSSPLQMANESRSWSSLSTESPFSDGERVNGSSMRYWRKESKDCMSRSDLQACW